MFLQGLSPREIATERKLTLGTVLGHLSTFVESGELQPQEIIGQERFERISRIIDRFAHTVDMNAIRALCPPGTSYHEIQLVMRARQ